MIADLEAIRHSYEYLVEVWAGNDGWISAHLCDTIEEAQAWVAEELPDGATYRILRLEPTVNLPQ